MKKTLVILFLIKVIIPDAQGADAQGLQVKSVDDKLIRCICNDKPDNCWKNNTYIKDQSEIRSNREANHNHEIGLRSAKKSDENDSLKSENKQGSSKELKQNKEGITGYNFETYETKAVFEIFLEVGKRWSNTNLNDISLFKNNEFVEKNSLLVGIGYCRSNLNLKGHKILFQTAILYNIYSITIEERTRPELSFMAARIPILFGYAFSLNKLDPYFSAGFQSAIKLTYKSHNTFLQEYALLSIGPEVNAGIKYALTQHVVAELNGSYLYEFKSILSWQQHCANVFSIQAKLGYRF